MGYLKAYPTTAPTPFPADRTIELRDRASGVQQFETHARQQVEDDADRKNNLRCDAEECTRDDFSKRQKGSRATSCSLARPRRKRTGSSSPLLAQRFTHHFAFASVAKRIADSLKGFAHLCRRLRTNMPSSAQSDEPPIVDADACVWVRARNEHDRCYHCGPGVLGFSRNWNVGYEPPVQRTLFLSTQPQ
jgi:hypothetical protein